MIRWDQGLETNNKTDKIWKTWDLWRRKRLDERRGKQNKHNEVYQKHARNNTEEIRSNTRSSNEGKGRQKCKTSNEKDVMVRVK